MTVPKISVVDVKKSMAVIEIAKDKTTITFACAISLRNILKEKFL